MYMYTPHGGEVSHDHVQGLDGFEGHAKLLSSKYFLQLVQIHLGNMFDANLDVGGGMGGGGVCGKGVCVVHH